MKLKSEVRKKIIDRARVAYGHIEGRSDTDCLVLTISHLEGLARERNGYYNLMLSATIELDKLREKVTGVKL